MIQDIRNLTQNKHKEQSFTQTLTMALKGAVCGRVYAEMMEQMKKLKEENESLKEENKKLKEENKEYDLEWCDIDNQRLTANALSDKLKEEMKELKEEMESMRKHRDTLLEESEESFMKIHKLEEEIESLTKSNKQKTKVIHTLRCELQKIYKVIHEDPPVLKDYKKVLPDVEELIHKLRKELKAEMKSELTNEFLSFECEECNLILTEDDIYGSLECGHLACEECRDKKAEEWETATDKIAQENSDLHNELKKLKMKLRDQATYEKRIFVLEQELNQKKKVLAKHGKKETSDSGESSGEESEHSADDCVCITCECHYSDMKHKGKLGMDKRYAWYFGSEHDDGDMCSRCLRKLYKEYHP